MGENKESERNGECVCVCVRERERETNRADGGDIYIVSYIKLQN